MKKLVANAAREAQNVIDKCSREAVEYVKEFKDEIDNLTVLESTGYDFVEVDPSEEIKATRYRYIMFGIDEDIIDGSDEFDAIYEALCILED